MSVARCLARWLHVGGTGCPVPGAQPQGPWRWSRTCEVLSVDPPHVITWRTIPTWRFVDSTEWTIALEPVGTGARIVQTFDVVRCPDWWEWLVVRLVKAHIDRTSALTDDLVRLGALVSPPRRASSSDQRWTRSSLAANAGLTWAMPVYQRSNATCRTAMKSSRRVASISAVLPVAVQQRVPERRVASSSRSSHRATASSYRRGPVPQSSKSISLTSPRWNSALPRCRSAWISPKSSSSSRSLIRAATASKRARTSAGRSAQQPAADVSPYTITSPKNVSRSHRIRTKSARRRPRVGLVVEPGHRRRRAGAGARAGRTPP